MKLNTFELVKHLQSLKLPDGISFYTIDNTRYCSKCNEDTEQPHMLFEIRGATGGICTSLICYLISTKGHDFAREPIEFNTFWSLQDCLDKINAKIDSFRLKLFNNTIEFISSDSGDLGREEVK